MTEKEIKRFYRVGLFLGMLVPTLFILAMFIGPRDMNMYYAIIYLGLIPALISFVGSIIWMILFLIKWLSDKAIYMKNFKIPFLLNLIILGVMGVMSLLWFILPLASI